MDLFTRYISIMIVFVIYIAIDVEGTAYGGACTADGDCTTDTNADKCDIGVTDTCICGAGYYRKTSTSACVATLALSAACDTADSNQCTVANAECDSATTTCLCKATHYLKGGACPQKIAPDTACATGDECVTNASCDLTTTNECKCDTGYTASPTTTPTMCSANGVVKFASLSYMYLVPILVSMMSLLR